jgi:hypothetical protein
MTSPDIASHGRCNTFGLAVFHASTAVPGLTMEEYRATLAELLNRSLDRARFEAATKDSPE